MSLFCCCVVVFLMCSILFIYSRCLSTPTQAIKKKQMLLLLLLLFFIWKNILVCLLRVWGKKKDSKERQKKYMCVFGTFTIRAKKIHSSDHRQPIRVCLTFLETTLPSHRDQCCKVLRQLF